MLRKTFLSVLSVVGLVAIVMIAGPRPDTTPQLQPVEIGDDVDAYLAAAESDVRELREGVGKRVVWFRESGRRTAISLVYLHGFSATARETAPLSDTIAARLGANLFYTRLTGHGRDGDAMGEARATDWYNDVTEAVAVGSRIGERVVIIGNSTGATLAVWWLGSEVTPDSLRAQVATLVLISPNFAPADARTRVATWPWGTEIARLMVGSHYEWTPRNELQAQYWVTRYPVEALVSMMAVVDAVEDIDPATITAPVMVVFSEVDQVVDIAKIRPWFDDVGAAHKKILEIGEVGDPSGHILAGDILSPASTVLLAGQITDFVRRVAL